MELIDQELAARLLPVLEPTRHKYQAGTVAVFAGSAGMAGSALLVCTAALKSGCGIVHWFYPPGLAREMARAPLELMGRPLLQSLRREDQELISFKHYPGACVLGPGLLSSGESRSLIKAVLQANGGGLVLDATALTLYGQEAFALPPGAVLTPHLGELQRLLHLPCVPVITGEFLASVQAFVDCHQVTMVVKGMPTYILHPQRVIHCSRLGNPGMATAGSGDVLGGIISGLLAQRLGSQEAALLGVYLHGSAGDLAAERHSPYSMVASDIIAELGTVYRRIAAA